MTKVRIHRSTNDLAVEFLKFFCSVAESNDVHGAHKGEVRGEREHIFPFVVR
jgi:hypothetical protein